MREKAQQLVLGSIALLSIFISIADMFGFFQAFLSNRVPSLTLLVLGLVAGYLVLERRDKLDNIEKLVEDGPERIIRALKGVDVQVFNNGQELFEYAAKKTRE